MGFIAWIVVGAIAGFLASQVMRAREGLLMMVVLFVRPYGLFGTRPVERI